MTKVRHLLAPALVRSFEKPETAVVRLGYMPQLDALRAFAVLAVMFQQFYGSRIGIELPIGEWGVQLFFVLSGFLITGILLNCRANATANLNREERKLQLRQFYIRRALRILPLFYLVVLGAALINIRPIRQDVFWHLTYTSNILVVVKAGWIGPASHFWSLAVEEQFYLLWPWLILWLPAQYLRPSILFIIALALLYKVLGYLVGLGPIPLFALTIACLDALGMGALLALYRKQKPELFDNLARDGRYSYFGFIAFSGALLSCLFWQTHYFVQVAGTFAATLFFVWLIHRAAVGFTGAPGRLLLWKPLIYLGQISYGLYIFHKFMSVVVPHAFDLLKLPFPQQPVTQALILITINIVVASCSWFLLEKPINNWKKRFKYNVQTL